MYVIHDGKSYKHYSVLQQEPSVCTIDKMSNLRLQFLLIAIILLGSQYFHLVQASTNQSATPTSSGEFESLPHNDSIDIPPRPTSESDPNQTQKAVDTIRSSNRKDILVWQTELTETQKYFNKLKAQNLNEEKISKTDDPVFRQWAVKTEERMSLLFGAMTTRLQELDKETAAMHRT